MNPNFKALLTIGHGNRSEDDFLSALQKYQIRFLVDVRTNPYSKYNPQYNREALESLLKANDIKYVFMGNELGGLPKDRSCYNEQGRVDYNVIKTKPFFQLGIERMKTAFEKQVPLTMMCSEVHPEDCHRCKLIGETLRESGVVVQHIDSQNNLKSQEDVINILNKGKALVDLFENPVIFTSRKTYT
jgi:uncharacterized protein (DUF488 family)